MIPLPRDLLHGTKISDCWSIEDGRLLQSTLGRDPWKVAVASVLLCRTRRSCVEDVLCNLLDRWPTPPALAASDMELEAALQPLGLHRQRARQLQRMSLKYTTDVWDDLRELPGIGKYVADAVGLVCFGCTELESGDEPLSRYAAAYTGPVTTFRNNRWTVREGDGVYEPKDSFNLAVLLNHLIDLEAWTEEAIG
jgi:hypothetical protein